MSEFVYCVNGTFVPASRAALALNDLGLVRGYGVFDVLRTYGRTPFHLRAHLERLQGSAAQIDLPLPWSLAELTAIVEGTLAQNDATDVTVRLVATAGASPGFLLPAGEPTILVLVAPVKPYAATCYTQGSSLITVDLPRFMPSVKSLNYISAVRGQQRARAQGAVEALYCTAAGELSECTTSNLFAFFGDQLVTPNVDVLAGITRGVALELAADLFAVVGAAAELWGAGARRRGVHYQHHQGDHAHRPHRRRCHQLWQSRTTHVALVGALSQLRSTADDVGIDATSRCLTN